MKDLFLSNHHSHPLIYLRGVKQQELVYILQFIYFGEANVHNKQIKKFLDIAKDFKLSVLSKSSSEIRIMPSTTECDTPTENDGICNLGPNNEIPENTIEGNLLEENLVYKSKQHQLEQDTRYSCNHCEYQTTRPNNLRAHERKQHDGILYSCNYSRQHGILA